MIQKLRPMNFMFLALFLSGVMVSSSYGQTPPEHFEDSFTIDGICAFPVQVELNGKAKTIQLPNGTTLFTSPGLVATFTNLDDPAKQESLGITGAIRESILANGDTEIVVTGRNLLIGLDPDLLFVVTIGNFGFAFDEDFNLVEPISGDGRTIDVCALLE